MEEKKQSIVLKHPIIIIPFISLFLAIIVAFVFFVWLDAKVMTPGTDALAGLGVLMFSALVFAFAQGFFMFLGMSISSVVHKRTYDVVLTIVFFLEALAVGVLLYLWWFR